MQGSNGFERRIVLIGTRVDPIGESLANGPLAAQPRGTERTTPVSRPGIDGIRDPPSVDAAGRKTARPQGFNS